MIDLIIFSVSLVTFFSFLFGLTLSVRAHGQTGVLSAIKNVFIVSIAIGSVFVWIFVLEQSFVMKCVLLFIYVFLVWSLSFSYILGIFGLPLTSLRIQILLTITQAGKRGISLFQLSRVYSTNTVVSQRLHRLETSGEIVKQGSRYAIRSRRSYFMLHNYFLLLLLKVYQPYKVHH